MNCLFIANSVHIGGGNRSLMLLARALRDDGHYPLVALPARGPMSDACKDAAIDCVVIPRDHLSWRTPIRSCSDQWFWAKELRNRRIDLIHANDPVSARPVMLPARMKGIPVIAHVRFPMQPQLISWVFKNLPKPCALVFNSDALQAECGPQFTRSAGGTKQYVVHNAVNLEEFRPGVKTTAKLRVGILANLVRVKGHVDFLHMARLVSDQGVDAEYWIIGGDIHGQDYKRELVDLCRELELSNHVKFLGHCNSVAELLNELDVVVCASHVEPFGRCLIEAMACGKPVVATCVGGIPEVVDDGVTGILVPPRSPHRLADSVARLLNDPELSERMGIAGRMRVEQFFSASAHLDAVLGVYREALKN